MSLFHTGRRGALRFLYLGSDRRGVGVAVRRFRTWRLHALRLRSTRCSSVSVSVGPLFVVLAAAW